MQLATAYVVVVTGHGPKDTDYPFTTVLGATDSLPFPDEQSAQGAAEKTASEWGEHPNVSVDVYPITAVS